MKAEQLPVPRVCPLGWAFRTHLPGVWGGPDPLEAAGPLRLRSESASWPPRVQSVFPAVLGVFWLHEAGLPAHGTAHSSPPLTPSTPLCCPGPRRLVPSPPDATDGAVWRFLVWSLTGGEGNTSSLLVLRAPSRGLEAPVTRPAAPQAATCQLPGDVALSGHLNTEALEVTPGFAFQTYLRAGPSRGQAAAFRCSPGGSPARRRF